MRARLSIRSFGPGKGGGPLLLGDGDGFDLDELLRVAEHRHAEERAQGAPFQSVTRRE
jgi:hypothetical protein